MAGKSTIFNVIFTLNEVVNILMVGFRKFFCCCEDWKYVTQKKLPLFSLYRIAIIILMRCDLHTYSMSVTMENEIKLNTFTSEKFLV